MAVAFRAAASGNGGSTASVTVTKPTGTVDGDVMIASVTGDKNAGSAPTAPAGWTSIGNVNPGGVDLSNAWTSTFYRVASGEGASYVFTQTSAQDIAAGIITFSGVDNTTPIDVSASASGTGSTITAPSVTTTVANTILAIVGGQQVGGTAQNWTSSGSLTERFENSTTGSGCGSWGGTEPIAAIGATGTRTITSNRSNEWVVFTVALKEPSGAAPPPKPRLYVPQAIVRAGFY